jgi:hypothetical protein
MAVISRGAAPGRLPGPPARAARPTPSRTALLACLALAAVSLLVNDEFTYDPTAWLVWGREITHLDLVTTHGPSWKPLPVLFTTPFALAGDTAAPLLWLVVARAGGLFAVVLAYRLAARFAGRWAGAIAALSLILESVFAYHFLRGNSEGLLAAAVLWGLERHLDGRPWQAFELGLAAGLIRPEVWTLVALYGLWLVVVGRREGRGGRAASIVAAGGALMLALWFVPELIGSGNLFRAASRALEPVPDSPAQAAVPFVAAFTNAAGALVVPTYVGALIAVVLAASDRPRGAPILGLAALSTVLMLSVAAGAQIGFTGNVRYVTLPASLVCVLAGIGWVGAHAFMRRRFGRDRARAAAAAAILVALPFVFFGASTVRDGLRAVEDQTDYNESLTAAIRAVGGPDVLKRCGAVYAGQFDTQRVAWELHLHVNQIMSEQYGSYRLPATVLAPVGSRLSHDPRFAPLGRTDRWIVASSCAAR